MPTTDKQYIPPEVLRLMELGRQGKLWTIEITYHCDSNTKLERKRNMTGDELVKYREDIFRIGFSVPIAAGHWRIVTPYDIVQVDLYKQNGYFPAP
jgi:hypothetical protein